MFGDAEVGGFDSDLLWSYPEAVDAGVQRADGGVVDEELPSSLFGTLKAM